MDILTKDDVYEPFLLTPTLFVNIISTVPHIPIGDEGPWWLAGDDDTIHWIDNNGYMNSGNRHNMYGDCFANFGIRPGFHLKLNKQKYKQGDKVMLNTTVCTVIATNAIFADIHILQRGYDDIEKFLQSPEFFNYI